MHGQFTFYFRLLAIMAGALSIAGIGMAAFAIHPTEPLETLLQGYHRITSMVVTPFESAARSGAGIFGIEFRPGRYWPNVFVASLLVLGSLIVAQFTDQFGAPEGRVASRIAIGLAAMLMYSILMSAAYLTGATVQIATLFSGNWVPLIPGLDGSAAAYLALPAYCGAVVLGTTRSIRAFVTRVQSRRGQQIPDTNVRFSTVERRAVWTFLYTIYGTALALILLIAVFFSRGGRRLAP